MKISRVNPLTFIKFQILLLQLEEYNSLRYIKSVWQTWGNIPKTFRKPLVWTVKLRIVSILACALQIIVAYILGMPQPVVILFLAIVCAYVYFIFLVVAVVILSPFDILIKYFIIAEASKKIRQKSHLTIIGIAGSYGKTLMKELLSAVLAQKYTVLKTPENINTPLGISALIGRSMLATTEVFIVEMGEYQPGDIRKICRITPPSMGVITGINEAHLERMGTLENTVQTIFELATEVPLHGTLILNGGNDRVVRYANSYTKGKNVHWYNTESQPNNLYTIKNYQFQQDGSGISFDVYHNGASVLHVQLPLLARYVSGVVIATIYAAREMGMSWQDISIGISHLVPPPHRLQPIRNDVTGILVIDDSYNGNPDGVTEAIYTLGKFKDRRKIYITPGLVEMGVRTREVHRKIGQDLAATVDLVILIKNSVTPYIAEGLKLAGYPDSHIIWFESATTAHTGFVKYLKPKDVVLFQNDWPDNYV